MSKKILHKKDVITNPEELKGNVTNMIGVGFSRRAIKPDGMPRKPPGESTNVFMLATKFNGGTIDKSKMCDGYVVTHKGMQVGLTTNEVKNFQWMKLNKNPDLRPGWGNNDFTWEQPPGTWSLGDNGEVQGGLLIDTGLKGMFMSNPAGYKDDFNRDDDYHITNEMTIRVKIGKYGEKPLASYEFSTSHLGSNDKERIRNVGRSFLTDYDYVYDAKHGYFGLRQLP